MDNVLGGGEEDAEFDLESREAEGLLDALEEEDMDSEDSECLPIDKM